MILLVKGRVLALDGLSLKSLSLKVRVNQILMHLNQIHIKSRSNGKNSKSKLCLKRQVCSAV